MADLTQTAANVVSGSGGSYAYGTAGGTLTAGMPLYIDSADSNKLKACDTSSAAKSACVGIALHGASAGQPVKYQTAGQINIGATLIIGTVYAVSDTGGAVCPIADNGSGDYGTILGVAVTAALLQLGINASGVAKA